MVKDAIQKVRAILYLKFLREELKTEIENEKASREFST